MDREGLLALDQKRKAMVAEFDSLLASLDAQQVGMHRTLTTFDGYPRDDVDVPLIRSQRQQVSRLENDIKAVMEEIRVGLTQVLSDPEPAKTLEPFCYVAQVEAGSKLQTGDKIIEFGSVNQHNHNALRGMATQLDKSPLNVTLDRDGVRLNLQLEPNGKLGARVMPL